MKIILLGPPGAGKGTFAVEMSKKYEIPHISTGDILRKAVKESTQIGLKARSYMDKGELVPDEIVVEMVQERMTEPDCQKGFILDGFPRTIKQAEMLEKSLEELALRIDKVIYLETEDKVIVERLTGRRTCKNCGTNYHVVNIPPQKEGICDNCGGELYQREDDNQGTILNRLAVYKKQTASLIDYYAEQSKLEKLDGGLSKEEVFKNIVGFFI